MEEVTWHTCTSSVCGHSPLCAPHLDLMLPKEQYPKSISAS